MADLDALLDDLRDRLNDSADTQVPEATKVRMLNYGIAATWPHLYRIVRDATIALVEDTYEYSVPTAVGSNSKILRVEVETEDSSGIFVPLNNFQIIPGITDPILLLEQEDLPSEAGSTVRITAAKQLTALAAGTDVYDGPAGTEELPVLYAMGAITNRRLDDRLDHRRFSSTVMQNAVSPTDIMSASNFYFSQFELLLDRLAMPLPSEQG